MKAAIFREHGGPDVVRVEDIPMPVPGRGEVLLQVRAAGLNHLDLWVRRGIPIETTMPHIGGSDVAGLVAEVGPGVDAALAGQRVVLNPSLWCGECRPCRMGEESMCERYRIIGEHTDGGFAEYLVVPADHLYPLPEEMSFEAAAALPVSYMTAWRALVSRARLAAGEDVLVIGASGGTALAAVQIALLLEGRVFAVTSGAENVRRLRDLGATFVYVTHDPAEATILADRIAVLGDGIVQQIGTPEELRTQPANDFVAAFFGGPQAVRHVVGAAR